MVKKEKDNFVRSKRAQRESNVSIKKYAERMTEEM